MHVVMLETTVPRGFHYVETLAGAGVEVSFVTEDLQRYAAVPGFDEHRHATRVVEVPATRDGGRLSGSLRGRLGPHPVDGVLCVHDQYVVAANRLAADLGVPHEDPRTVELLRDKAAVRRRVAEAGLGSVRWCLVGSPALAAAAAARVGFPLVVKPLDAYGSMGVDVAWTARQLTGLLGAATGPLLLEQYVAGRHVSAEVLVQDGRPLVLGFAERLPAPPGVTAELGGHFPARFEGLGAARRLVADLVRVLGIRNSALHVELMMTATGPELIEVNARVAGHVVSEQITRALDRSVTLDLLALAVGQPLAPVDEPVATLALRHFWTRTPGVLRTVGIPSLPAEVVRCEPVVAPGQAVRPLRHNFDRLGYVLTEAAAPATAIAAADDVLREVTFEITPDPGPAPADEPRGDRHGRHVVLLLDDDDPERVLDAAGAATRHLSVVFHGTSATARSHWAQRFHGQWLDGDRSADVALKELHATDPVQAVISMAPRLAAPARALRAVLTAEPAPPPAGRFVAVDAGRVQVLLAVGDTFVPWAVLARRGGDWTVNTSPGDAVPNGRPDGPGVVCRWSAPDGTVGEAPGIEGPLRALCDAALSRDLASAVIAAQLGQPVEAPVRRRAAVLRRLPAPAGAFRVAEATTAAELYADPDVTYVDPAMPTGHRHPGGTPAHWLSYVVAGDGTHAADRIERSLRFRTVPQDRTHVLVVDRFGPPGRTRPDGTPVLPPDRFQVTAISNHRLGLPHEQLLHADVFDQPVLQALAEAVHAGHPVDRVACGTEHLLIAAAGLRARLRVPGDSPRQARAVRDKAEMKRLARRAGIAHAPGLVLYEPAEATRLLAEHGTIVVKPRDRSGAQGVHVIGDNAALDDWLRTTFLPGAQLAEAHQPGPVCHIDAVVHRGIVAWDVAQYGADALGFATGRPVTSCTVDDLRLRDHARDLLDQVLAAWEIASGVLHVEAFDAGDHLVFGELAGRAGGGGIPAAFRITRGIDLRHAKLATDAGDDPRRLLGEPVAPHAGWLVHYSPGGRLVTYDDAAVAPLAAHREVHAAAGDDVPAALFRGTGLATYAFAGETAPAVRALLRRAADDIHLRFEPTE